MSNVNVLAIFETKPEASEPFRELFQQISKQLPQAAGCLSACAYACSDSANKFMMYEEWESQAAHQAHIAMAIASGAWDKIAVHLAQEPEISYYTLVDNKPR